MARNYRKLFLLFNWKWLLSLGFMRIRKKFKQVLGGEQHRGLYIQIQNHFEGLWMPWNLWLWNKLNTSLNTRLAGTGARHLILRFRWTVRGNYKWSWVGWSQQGIKTSRLVLWELWAAKKRNESIGKGDRFEWKGMEDSFWRFMKKKSGLNVKNSVD